MGLRRRRPDRQSFISELSNHPWHVRYFNRLNFDLTKEQTCPWFESELPACIINLAAYTEVDKAESEVDLSFAVNANGVLHLAQLCSIYHIPLVHISSDYVFSGEKKEPYTEDALCAPKNIYGQSKAMGERYIQEKLSEYIIVRTSWVFSDCGKNFVTKILKKAQQQKRCLWFQIRLVAPLLL